MNVEHWRRVQELFEAGLDRSVDERRAWLEEVCSEDPELKAEVSSLLEAADEDRVAHIISDAALEVLGFEQSLMAGKLVGPYRIEREIGRGGMGTVYLAERADGHFEQHVAIKVVRERLARPDLAERFRTERQILAKLEHPNIARLLDGGTTDEGSPFVVMEHVEGLPIDRYCQEQRLSLDDRLRLFLALCDAVSYAHRNLVVHRDLKPSNVLVTPDGQPKLLDFGVARLLDPTGDPAGGKTRTVARMLTPEYASPEQVRGEPVSTAGDVYSLGVILYELLTGTHPYSNCSPESGELERAICEQEPTPPSTAVPDKSQAGVVSLSTRELVGDLDNIVLMALRKEPERRYTSAAELADDIHRYLDRLPVRARPSTWRYRSGKFVRRHALAVGFAATIALLTLSAAVVSSTLYFRADRAQATTEEINRFLTEMLASVNPTIARGEDSTLLRRILDETAERIDAELTDQPEVAAALHATIGATYSSLGLYETAEHHHRESLRLEQEIYGDRSTHAAKALRRLSIDLRELSHYDEAETLARSALAISRERLGDDHLDTAANLHNVGIVLFSKNSIVDAEPFFREALRVRRNILGHDDPDVAETLLMLAHVVDTPPNDDIEQAEELLLEAQRIWRRDEDRYALLLSQVAQTLGELFVQKRRFDLAESSFREALETKQRILPPQHPETAVTLNRMASMFESRGDFEKAEPAYRQALSIQRVVLGPDHRDLGTTLNNLAGTLRKVGRHAEAGKLYREAIEIYSRALGPEHLWVGIVLGSLAANYEAEGRSKQCEQTAAECIRIRSKEWAADHWRIITVESIRGACIAAQGRYAESEPILLRSAALLEENLGAEHAGTLQAKKRLADLYQTWRKPR